MQIGPFTITKDNVEKAETVVKSWVGDPRVLLLVGFGLFVYFAKSVLTTEIELTIAGLVALHMICHTASHIVEIIGETKLRSERQRLAWTDGVLTAEEASVLDAAETVAKGGTATIIPPKA